MLPRAAVRSSKHAGLVALTLAVGLAGCAHTFPLETARVAEHEALVVALTRVVSEPLAHPGRLRVELRADTWPSDMTLRGAVVAPADAIPCTWGLWAEAAVVDGEPVMLPQGDMDEPPGAIVRDGGHIVVEFGQEAFGYLERGKARVDVLLAGDDDRVGCAAVPLADAPRSVKEWERHEGAHSLELLLEAAGAPSAIRGVVSNLAFIVRFGRWLGPVRPYLSVGAGLGFCSESQCPPTVHNSGESERNSGYMVPLGFGTAFDLHAGRRHALRVAVEYDVVFNKQNYFGGTERFLLHALAVSPGIMFSPGKSRVERGWFGLEVPVRMVTGNGVPAGLSVGASLVLGTSL